MLGTDCVVHAFPSGAVLLVQRSCRKKEALVFQKYYALCTTTTSGMQCCTLLQLVSGSDSLCSIKSFFLCIILSQLPSCLIVCQFPFLHKKGTAAPNLGDMKSSRKKAILHVIENSIWHIIVFADNAHFAQWPGRKGFHLRFSLFAYELALFKVREDEIVTLKNSFQLSWHQLDRVSTHYLHIYMA